MVPDWASSTSALMIASSGVPQLVAGVGQEPLLLLQRVLLRGLGATDSVQHVVQRPAEAADLIIDRRNRQRRPFGCGNIIAVIAAARCRGS